MSPWSFPYPFLTFTHLFLHFWAFLEQNWARFGLLLSARHGVFFWNRFCFWAIWNFPPNPTNLDSGAPPKILRYIARVLVQTEKNGCLLKDWKSHTFPFGIWLPKIICVWPIFFLQELSNGNFFEGPENPSNATFLFLGFFFKACIKQKRWDNGGESLNRVATFLGGKGGIRGVGTLRFWRFESDLRLFGVAFRRNGSLVWCHRL